MIFLKLSNSGKFRFIDFVRKCTNTKWCLIPNFVKIGRDLHILDEFDFLIFFIVTSNYKHSMYPRSFLCKEAKIKQGTSLKKELCEIGEEAIWESRFTSFFYYRIPNYTANNADTNQPWTELNCKFYHYSKAFWYIRGPTFYYTKLYCNWYTYESKQTGTILYCHLKLRTYTIH